MGAFFVSQGERRVTKVITGSAAPKFRRFGGFARTPLASDVPDVQMHFVPGYRSHRGRLFEWGHGYAIHTCVLRPKSIGEVRLAGDRSLEIDFNFFDDPEDAKTLVEGVKLARRILAQPEF